MAGLYGQQHVHRITSLEKGTWTSRSYREAVLRHLQPVIPYDAYCFTTVDPSTLLSTGAVTEDGVEAIHDQLFINEYMEEDIHKYADLVQSDQHTAILYAAVHSNPESSVRYKNILLPAGFGDEMRTVFISNDSCWGYLTLYRKADQPAFTEQERSQLEEWTYSIAKMLRITSLTLIEEMKRESPAEPGILLASNALKLVSLNTSAEYWISQLRLMEGISPNTLPRPVRAVASHLLSQLQLEQSAACKSLCASPSKVCIQLPDGRYLMLQASHLKQLDGSDQIAVMLNQAMPQELLSVLAECHGLSPREREVLGYVLRSYSSKEIAAAMYISAYTVQDHLKSIFDKTGVSSRRELIWYFVSRFQLTDELTIG
ncbi:helix-turn-helix transcriptional regulator [Paenibacillus sp. FSL R7-0652]|uniref:helix-turn-helix transcriptional regulator n=1 Tax=Paenibacillus sp. FSL R7-0652 TaxID=2921687 RepID=UPI00315A98C2